MVSLSKFFVWFQSPCLEICLCPAFQIVSVHFVLMCVVCMCVKGVIWVCCSLVEGFVYIGPKATSLQDGFKENPI